MRTGDLRLVLKEFFCLLVKVFIIRFRVTRSDNDIIVHVRGDICGI
jgi:hypothetical protein